MIVRRPSAGSLAQQRAHLDDGAIADAASRGLWLLGAGFWQAIHRLDCAQDIDMSDALPFSVATGLDVCSAKMVATRFCRSCIWWASCADGAGITNGLVSP